MPINTDLNVDPYFDDYNLEKQFYKVLFKPSYAVQARELTQLQTILQNQVEQFGDNIFKEGSIIKGCTFTELDTLSYVKLVDKVNFDVADYVGFADTVTVAGETFNRDNTYEVRGTVSGVKASIIAAQSGFETRNPNLNTFYINYITTSGANKTFQTGELLEIYKLSTVEVGSSIDATETFVDSINITSFSGAVGNSFGLSVAPGVVYQKGHFLYSEEQLVIVSKYSNAPDSVSVGFGVDEKIINSDVDDSLLDNANGSFNQNAPGADRLKLIPVLKALETSEAEDTPDFFTLVRYSLGNAVVVRDVAQYNVLGDEMARRTHEESGDYTVQGFETKVIRQDGSLKASVGTGQAYIKGYRVETVAESILPIDEVANTSIGDRTNQAVSFGYGSYVNLEDTTLSGTVELGNFEQVTLKDDSDTDSGTARVRNITDNKIFLFDIRTSAGKKFSDIEKIVGTAGEINIANNSIFQQANKTPMVFPTGMISLNSASSMSIPVRAQKSLSGLSGSEVLISPDAGEDFALTNDDVLLVDSTNTKISVLSNNLQGADLRLVLASTPAATGTVYYNKRILDADPFTKVSATLFVKCDFDAAPITSANSKYNLGFPDVYEIVSITDDDDKDVTSSFRLRTNQKDNYYDHSYIEYIAGKPLPAEGNLTVEMKAFKLNDTTGDYFFTINSYPTDIPKNKIPVYNSPTGSQFSLRDSLDFRPYCEPLSPATYTNAADESTAPVVSTSATGVNVAPTFSSSYEILTPAHNQFGQIDYDFYFNRTDIVLVDSFSKISILKGNEADNSIPPSTPSDQLKIAEIYVPGKPALSPAEAQAVGRPEFEVRVTRAGVRAYRMRDIQSLERKIDAIKYYVLLSTLEAETKNLNVIDENGLSRFKNGIIVDPFNDLSIANLDNAEYNAAIDFTEKSLMPAVKSFPINLKLKTFSNSSVFPSADNPVAGTLLRDSDISIISQTNATDFRNCVSNFYNYVGDGALFPEYDALYDTVTDPLNIDIDLFTPLDNLVDAIQEFIPLTSTTSELIGRTTTGSRRTGTTTTTTFRDTTTSLQLSGENANEQHVGDFVTNFEFNPYMRARDINIFMAGLRPNTQHYFFFDEKDMNSNVFPANGLTTTSTNPAEFVRAGAAGAAVTSDANGIVRAIFSLPEGTFFVGDRQLEIADVDTYSSIESGKTSYGKLMYRAYNFSVEKSSLTATTRTPESFINTASTERTVTRRRAPQRESNPPDPIAQTFFIKEGMGSGSETVFVSKLDIFFKRKSSVNGVTVDLREVINGYPSFISIPFSKIHLSPSDIQVSDDASLATTVSFKAPVRLDAEKEYAFAIKPDAGDPEYLVFTSKVGGINLSPGNTQGLTIVQDWGDGVLFTSTNNRAWKSYQDEDIKFTLYRHNFNASTGTITLTNDDNEFFTTTNNIGRFVPGEIVYATKDKDASTAVQVGVVSGNNQISGTNLSSTFAAGDYILVDDDSTNKQIFKVESANSTVIIADRPAFFTASIDSDPIVLGNISHYNFRYPEFLILEKSSAKTSRKFEANDSIFGFDSGTTATISSVDNKEISYIQPMINRTTDIVSSTLLDGNFVNPTTGVSYDQSMLFNDKTLFSNQGMIVYSRSNDIPGNRGMDLTISLANGGNVTSTPFIDIETASVLAHEWKISEDTNTTAKYISTTVELAENLDAEDMTVYTTAYRPNGTDVKVFIKPQHATDPSVFDENDWIELTLTEGINQYSSVSNPNDFREFVYTVPASAKNAFDVLTYTNDLSTFEGYRRFAIKIELHSENIFKAPRLLDYRGIALT